MVLRCLYKHLVLITVSHEVTSIGEFEIGFPSQKESLIMRYCEDESKPTDTVYAFVPFNVVNDVLEKHGGIDIDATLKRAEEMQKSA